ncbi:MAG TPA: NAD(P)H-dependent oxidoreductase subunit E [Actinomycetota bacterium]|jgi:NADH-quinone oxidoreductase subunit E|nr:NAD(P)H-dependent oxidoreductase subunit E [Actinomycetota bacterium]
MADRAVLTPELREQAEGIKARYPRGRERSAVMPLLYLMQSVDGRVTREGLQEVADLLGITTAEVEAVATFYTMIRLAPTGRYLLAVCTNLPCALHGGRETLEAARRAAGIPEGEEVSEDGLFTVDEEECLAACDAAPVVSVNFANYDRTSAERVTELIEALRRGEEPAPSRGPFPGDVRRMSRVLAGLPPEELVP